MFIEDIKLTIFVLLIGLLIVTFLSSIQIVVAQEDLSSIMFTEIMYDLDGTDDKREWVEIYNSGDTTLEVNGDWRFFDGSNHLLAVAQGDQFLEQGEAAVIVDGVEDFLLDYPEYLGTIIDSVVKLNNVGEEIKLSLDNGESWVLQSQYTADLGANGDGYSLEYLDGAWLPSVNMGGSPGIYLIDEVDDSSCYCEADEIVDATDEVDIVEDNNSVDDVMVDMDLNTNNEDNNIAVPSDNFDDVNGTEQTVYSDRIFINELLPDPNGSDEENEYIELFNNDSFQVNLSDWWLEDASEKKYALSGIIEPDSYVVIYRVESKITLNNSTGDIVKLYNPIGDRVDEIQYDESMASQGYSKFVEAWLWTAELTPGAENVFPVEVVEESMNDEEEMVVIAEDEVGTLDIIDLELRVISDIKDFELNSEVYTQGLVTALPGCFAETYFYISEVDFEGNVNLSTGIQIYFSKKDFPEMSIGDVVVVLGKLSETGGEKRIKISERGSIQILDTITMPVVSELLTGEVNDDFEGGFVSVIGDLVDKKSTSWYLDDDSGEIRVYINSKAGISKPDVELGQEVMVSGIVSETTSGFRLLPRFDEDISVEQVIVEQVEPEINVISVPEKEIIDVIDQSDGGPEDYLGYGLGVVGLTMLSWVLKLKFF